MITSMATSNAIESADGTGIALDRTGTGPPVVIVLGAFCDRSTSKPLAALLTASFTVYEYDRRGRGDSGNGSQLTVAGEVEDLAAVVAATGEPPFVYGHSSGGALALEAAARGVEMRKLAVYEPPYTGESCPGPEFGQHLDRLVAAGRRDEAAEEWLAMTGTPPAVIESMKMTTGWAHRQALAHTLSQDLRLSRDGRVPIERLRRIDAPVLALAGGASPPWAASVTAKLVSALPHARAQIVDGQRHMPTDGVVAAILERFFR
jgi:pimeloyl-ACP methyl ester carboxylesterase